MLKGWQALEEALESRLHWREKKGLKRSLEESPPCPIDLTTNDYLRLASPEVYAGPHGGGRASRLLLPTQKDYLTLEKEFSEFVGQEAALYFSSGYAANFGLLSCLSLHKGMIFYDEQCHASLRDGIRLNPLPRSHKKAFPHNDLTALGAELRASPDSLKMIVVESLYSMSGLRAPLSELAQLAEETGAILIIDEAHAIGVLGPRGRGLIHEVKEFSPFPPHIATYPCGKGLGGGGAFVCGSALLKDYLVNECRPFIYSTSPPIEAISHLRRQLKRCSLQDERRLWLKKLSQTLRAELPFARGEDHIVIIQTKTPETTLHAKHQLAAKGIAVQAINPPTVKESCLRLCLHSNLTQADLTLLISSLKELRALL